MSYSAEFLEKFLPYIEYYPCKGEQGYDGVHDGGFKCFREGAPEDAAEAYAEFLEMRKRHYNEKDESGARIKY